MHLSELNTFMLIPEEQGHNNLSKTFMVDYARH